MMQQIQVQLQQAKLVCLADGAAWPVIQLYSLSQGGNVDVQYNKGGGAQSVQLTFDTVDQFAGATLDRAVYPQGSQIHATITDLWLNIDPTDEDSWTFGTNAANTTSAGAHYQVFDENGLSGGAAINIDSRTNSLMCEDNCRLFVDQLTHKVQPCPYSPYRTTMIVS